MNKVWRGILSVFVLLAIAKVLVAQPTEVLEDGTPDPSTVVMNEQTGEVIPLNEEMVKGAMQMNELEPPPVEDEQEGGGY